MSTGLDRLAEPTLAALRINVALYAQAASAWHRGLKRGGEGRKLADWLAMNDVHELSKSIRFGRETVS